MADDFLDEKYWEYNPFFELEPPACENSPLRNTLLENGILNSRERLCYKAYAPANRGCSLKNPIIISATKDYVSLEYQVLPYIIRSFSSNRVDYQVIEQHMVLDNDRYLDVLVVRVTELQFDKEKPISDSFNAQEERYFFDISAGFQSLRRG